ncbi:MAG: hypothetical protein FJX73_03855 [Armatimonadetes bacterium]|nr:hypothetical protein [Armatimonadota bacterium]
MSAHIHALTAWATLLVLAVPAAGAAQIPGVWAIVPGEAIGPVKIGMTAAQVRSLLGRLPCEIAVAYTDGRVSRLETNCGVAYQTAEGITVGLDGSRVWWIHGPPDQAVPSNFAGTRADWLLYRGAGIGFRVIYAEGGTLIQAVSVFRGTGAPAVRRPPAPVPVVPPPVLGD